MSIVPKETIEVIAQSIGIGNLSPEVSLALAPDVEYRLREIMQEAIKCMRHSKRTTLTADDVDSALGMRNIEPIYGFACGDPLRFKKAMGHKDLFYVDDKDIDFKDVIEAPLPKAPLDTTVATHWLAIEGVQPAIPENVPPEALTVLPENKKIEHMKEDAAPVDLKLPVKHVLSRELQLYFDKITELTLTRSESILFKEALLSLATDSGIHQLVPYFSYFIADEVARNLNNLPCMFALMRVVQSLHQNPHIHIEPYLHQLMPSVVTCLVTKRLGSKFSDNHWALRDFTANLVASICRRFGHTYHNLQSRLTKTLLHAFMDPSKSLQVHYGAVQGLAALGSSAVRLFILPNLETYLQLLKPEMLLEKQKNEMKRSEAWRVYGALLRAAGCCLHEKLKMMCLSSPLTRTALKTNGRVATTLHDKRKAGPNISPHQPLKKLAADDGSVGIMANSSVLTTNISQTSSGQDAKENTSGGGRKDGEVDYQSPKKASSVLLQAWKEDMDSGSLLTPLFELFGESIFPFTKSAEMSMFL